MILDISGLDKAAVLVALYNHSSPQGSLTPIESHMTVGEAQVTINRLQAGGNLELKIDRLGDRSLGVKLAGDQLDPSKYDGNNGTGAAARALIPLWLEQINSMIAKLR